MGAIKRYLTDLELEILNPKTKIKSMSIFKKFKNWFTGNKNEVVTNVPAPKVDQPAVDSDFSFELKPVVPTPVPEPAKKLPVNKAPKKASTAKNSKGGTKSKNSGKGK